MKDTPFGSPRVGSGAAVMPLVQQDRVGRCALRILPVVDVVSADLGQALESQRGLAALGLRGRKVPDLVNVG